ncbi:MAG: UDP-2,3-diacylglucosamine diphosphatase [Gammaproteobacteria bacterium]|nr:UDP-2,3-diacylglucosamine diphosphatase [Gammaproteobacteria bacterium]
MSHTLFISDLHLDPARPRITELFLDFLANDARQAEALYILGDLFEAWIGDDDPDEHHGRIQDAMAALSATGVNTYFMHGNRDFLVGKRFSERTGFTLLDDPTVIDLYGVPTVLLHGDTLCTDDVEYLKVREQLHDPQWQSNFLSQSLEARKAFAAQARADSKAAQSGKAMDIMDANREAVASEFLAHDVSRMIHGHTHRPGIHTFPLEGRTRQRIVLGDWYEQGSLLRCSPAGVSLLEIPLD